MTRIYNYIVTIILRVINKIGIKSYPLYRFYNLNHILQLNFKNKFTFIQVGANDGVSFDSLYEFVTTRQSTGLVIEPVSEYFKELVNNYKDYPEIIKINKAVHPFEKNKNIYKIKESSKYQYPHWVKGIASFDPDHHKKTKIDREDIEVEIVEADTLMNIVFHNYSYNKIDYLQIDTEGYDLEILKLIDFATIKPAIIKYEYINLEKSDVLLAKILLLNQGYFLFDEGYNTIGVDLKRIRLL